MGKHYQEFGCLRLSLSLNVSWNSHGHFLCRQTSFSWLSQANFKQKKMGFNYFPSCSLKRLIASETNRLKYYQDFLLVEFNCSSNSSLHDTLPQREDKRCVVEVVINSSGQARAIIKQNEPKFTKQKNELQLHEFILLYPKGPYAFYTAFNLIFYT